MEENEPTLLSGDGRRNSGLDFSHPTPAKWGHTKHFKQDARIPAKRNILPETEAGTRVPFPRSFQFPGMSDLVVEGSRHSPPLLRRWEGGDHPVMLFPLRMVI